MFQTVFLTYDQGDDGFQGAINIGGDIRNQIFALYNEQLGEIKEDELVLYIKSKEGYLIEFNDYTFYDLFNTSQPLHFFLNRNPNRNGCNFRDLEEELQKSNDLTIEEERKKLHENAKIDICAKSSETTSEQDYTTLRSKVKERMKSDIIRIFQEEIEQGDKKQIHSSTKNSQQDEFENKIKEELSSELLLRVFKSLLDNREDNWWQIYCSNDGVILSPDEIKSRIAQWKAGCANLIARDPSGFEFISDNCCLLKMDEKYFTTKWREYLQYCDDFPNVTEDFFKYLYDHRIQLHSGQLDEERFFEEFCGI